MSGSGVIEAGQSRELVELFRSISESDLGGERRFRDKDCRLLRKVIACRIYAKPVLELCHMIHLAAACDRRGRMESLFWEVVPATGANFRDRLFSLADSGRLDGRDITLEPGFARLVYPDGEFEISYNRMPFLAVLLDFLVNSTGYSELMAYFDAVASAASVKELSDASNSISKAVYHFLEDHLPSVQNQKKLRQITGFLEARLGGDMAEASIDDDCLLDFWREASLSEDGAGANFVAFATVFDAFVRFVQAMEHGRSIRSFDHMASIGPDREFEVDPDSLMGRLEVIEEDAAPLELLGEAPLDRIKFLNKRETEALAYLLPRWREVARWPLSFLRADVFGRGQGRITQALRNKVLAEELQALLQDSAQEDYDGRLTGYDRLAGHLGKLLLAALYVVGRAEAEGETVEIDFAAMNDARKAFKALSRKGFEEEGLDDPDVVAAFEQASAPLVTIRDQLARALEDLQKDEGWQTEFEIDRSLFGEQFGRIYGDQQ